MDGGQRWAGRTATRPLAHRATKLTDRRAGHPHRKHGPVSTHAAHDPSITSRACLCRCTSQFGTPPPRGQRARPQLPNAMPPDLPGVSTGQQGREVGHDAIIELARCQDESGDGRAVAG